MEPENSAVNEPDESSTETNGADETATVTEVVEKVEEVKSEIKSGANTDEILAKLDALPERIVEAVKESLPQPPRTPRQPVQRQAPKVLETPDETPAPKPRGSRFANWYNGK